MRALAAISLGNLCYLRMWDSILHSPERDYLAATSLRRIDYIAAVIGAGVFGVIAYSLIFLMWYAGKRWVRGAAIVALVGLLFLPLDFARRSAGVDLGREIAIGRYVTSLGGGGLIVSLALYFRQRFFSAVLWTCALLSPYAAINCIVAAAHVFNIRPSYSGNSSHPSVAARAASHRLVWLVFDECDEVATFEKRAVPLPNIDALVAQSVRLLNALPPSGRTMISLPSMLTGERIIDARPDGGDDLLIKTVTNGEWRSFKHAANLVTRSIDASKSVFVAGWYHPYDRLFPRHTCLRTESVGFPGFEGYRKETLFECVYWQISCIVSPFYGRDASGQDYEQLHRAALRYVADASVDLAFIHYNIPHQPEIYDERSGRMSHSIRSGADGYYANLALVDKTVGDLRQAIESAGLTGNTSIILTSDHWWRSAPWLRVHPSYRVPLIVYPGGGGAPRTIGRAICTNALAQLATEILDGRVNSTTEIVNWFGRSDSSIPVGYESGRPVWK